MGDVRARPLVSIVTPCFNEEENVENHYESVLRAVDPFRDKYDFEHIYTDNCSADRTFELLTALGTKHEHLRAMRFSRNIGAERAIFFALEHAKGDAIVIIQADFQDPPEIIPDFIRGWEEGYDVVYGKIKRRREGYILQLCRRIYYSLTRALSDVPLPTNAGEFRLMSRRALDALLQFRESDLYVRAAVAQVGFRQKPVEYVRQGRAAGSSSVNLVYLIGYALNGLLSTTVVPIRFVAVSGLGLSAIGFLATASLVLGKLIFKSEVPHGFTTLAALVTFFAGAQLLALGIIGEYVRKIYVQSLHRPRGFIQDRVNL